MNVRVTRAARTQIAYIFSFVEERSPRAARRIAAAIEMAIASLAEYPPRGRTGRLAGTRELLVPGVPYLLVYRVDPENGAVLVANVYHHAQDR